MKKSAIVMFSAVLLSVSALAQSVQEGVNHLYAKRYQSAKSVFDKLLAANPNNIDAIYWLGQNYIAQKNTAEAKAVYDKALATNGNAPLLIVGAGNVDLLEGKQAEARSRFETAINTSKGKKGPDPMVLSAVGRAVTSAHSEKNKQDLDYAISKLNEAVKLAPNNADIYLNLGNANRLKGRGGDAVSAYMKATQLNTAFAVPYYRMATLYRSHTSYRSAEGWNSVLENLNAAVAADPKFAPAYEELYYYNLFAKQDLASAQNYSKLYIANADPSPDNKYLELQVPIVGKNWQQVVTLGKQMIAETKGDPNPRVYRAMTVASMGLKDTASACEYINQFFAKSAEDDILSSDYILRAQTCGRGNPEKMRTDIVTAIMSDSVLSRQLRLINESIDDAKAAGDQCFSAELRMMSYQLRTAKNATTTPTELISYMAIPFYLGGCYERADSIANEYTKLAPDSIYGYYWGARARQAIDTGANTQGSFVAGFQKTLEIGLTDTVRYMSMGTTAARSLAIYFANEKRDYKQAMEYVQMGERFNRNDANLQNIRKLLQPYLNKKATSNAPAQKTSTSTGQAKTEVKKETKPKEKSK